MHELAQDWVLEAMEPRCTLCALAGLLHERRQAKSLACFSVLAAAELLRFSMWLRVSQGCVESIGASTVPVLLLQARCGVVLLSPRLVKVLECLAAVYRRWCAHVMYSVFMCRRECHAARGGCSRTLA